MTKFWQSIFSPQQCCVVHHLIDCLQEFVRAPKEEEWARVRAYAARVRVIGHIPHSFASPYLTPVIYLSGPGVTTLNECLGATPLFPGLRKFSWSPTAQFESSSEQVASLQLFLNSTASTIDITMPEWDDDSAAEIAKAFEKLGDTSSQLRSINIVSAARSVAIEEAVLELGTRQEQLRELNYTWEEDMSMHTIMELSKRHSLNSLTICVDAYTSKRVLEKVGRGAAFFPSLKHLELITKSLEVAEPWLQALHRTGLQSIHFNLERAAAPSALEDFFTKLTEHPSRATLRHLRITSRKPLPRNAPAQSVFPAALAPLFQLDLHSFKLDPGVTVDIDDEYIAQVAQHWPRLEFLEISADYRRYWNPRVTLPGLVPLARGCPDITTLSLPLDTTTAGFRDRYEAGHRPGGGAAFNHCYTFGVGPSAIAPDTDVFLVAGFLSDLCPHLVKVETAWSRPHRPDPRSQFDKELADISDKWNSIDSYGREMARVRRQERGWMHVTEDIDDEDEDRDYRAIGDDDDDDDEDDD